MDIEEENVKVVVRIRPMQTDEKKSGDIPCVKAINDGHEVQVKVGPLDAQVYRCNNCFNPETNQVDFFLESGITDLLDSAIKGYRACAFAFGQTGAGKTHTMIGSAKGISSRDKNVGLVPRSLDYLYEKMTQMNMQFKIKLSCLEIYHEHVYDLFAEDKERTPMAVREHNVEGFFLEGARLVDCSNYNIACSVLDVAFKNRQVGFHDLNSRSSRSHCMTEIYIETFPEEDNPEQVVRGKMSLIDLAGSERLKSTNSTGKVLQEAGFINRSLYVLGKVIAGLVRTNGDLNHKDVPYRDSKLTKLLINSLGGSSRTLMISCVSEAKGSQAETLRTLKFSMSCARIRNKPVKFLDPQEKLIVNLKDEIKRLRQENQRLRSTLLTAPSSTDSLHSFPGGDGLSPGRVRASSANNGMSPTRRRVSPEKMRKGMPAMTKKRTTAVAGVGGQGKKSKNMAASKKKKPEIFYKYPQLEKILGDDESVESFSSPNRGRAKNAGRDSGKARQPPQQQHAVHSSSAAESIMMAASAYDNHPDDNDSIHSHQSHNSHRRMNHEVLDEMVHRRAPGPMILKDVQNAPYAPLRETRLNKYYPAENNIRSMDQKKIDVLEERIAKMESQQRKLEQLQKQKSNDPNYESEKEDEVSLQHSNAVQDEDATIQNAIAVDGSEMVKAGKKAGKKAQKKKKEKGVSPYIAHMDTNKLKNFQREITEPKKRATELPPVTNPASKVSSRRAVAAMPELYSQKVRAAAAEPHPHKSHDQPRQPQQRQDKVSASDVKSSIDQELEELGLSEILGISKSNAMPEKDDFANIIAAATKPPVGSSKSSSQIDKQKNLNTHNKTAPSKSQSLPQIQSKQQQVDGGALISAVAAANNTKKRGSKDAGDKSVANNNRDVADKLPIIQKSNVTKSETPMKVETKTGIAAASPSAKKKSTPASSPQKLASPQKQKYTQSPNNQAEAEEDDGYDDDDFMPPTPDRLKEQLNELEASLVSKRMEMEDNPGDVTNEIEEKFKHLQLETLVIKQQLSELTGDMFGNGGDEGESRGHSASLLPTYYQQPTEVASSSSNKPASSPARQQEKEKPEKEEEADNYEDDEYYADEDFENEDAGSPARPRTQGSPKKSTQQTPAAIVVTSPPPKEKEMSPAKAASPSAKSPTNNGGYVASAIPVYTKEVSSPVSAQSPKEAAVPDSIHKNSVSPAAIPITVAANPKAAADNTADEDDEYADDYDGEFDEEEDVQMKEAKPQATIPATPSAATTTSSSSTKAAPVPSTGINHHTPTSVSQAENAITSVTSHINVDPTPEKVVISPNTKRAKTPAKANNDEDDEDAYADDGFDDYDVSFNEDG